MGYNRVKQEKISDQVADQMENHILSGLVEPGERLPAERELAQQFNVSRPSLREAIQKLESKGLLETRQGGGTFVKNVFAPVLTDPLSYMFSAHPNTVEDFIEFRSIMEGNTAYYAALRATDADREILTACFKAMKEAHDDDDPDHEAKIDADFHLAIAEAAHNVVMLHVMRSLVDVLREGVFYNRMQLYSRRGSRDLLLNQHKAMFDAIINGNPEGAREAARAHLKFVMDALRDMEREDQRQDIANRRLERFREQQEARTKKSKKK